jgi:hypothetical protein
VADSQAQKALKTFYNALKDEPLEPDDKFYVPGLHVEDVGGDPILDLATQIDWDEGGGVYPFTGQRGTGKSTELLRLRVELRNRGHVAYIADMAEYMNLTTAVEIGDFLIAIMGALSERVEGEYREDPTYQSFWDRIVAFLGTEVKLDGIDLKGGGATLKLSLREDPDFRRRVQEGLRGHVAKLTLQAREFAGSVVALLRKRSKDPAKKVVFIVDSLERIRGVGGDAEAVYKSVENLFSGHADKLVFPPLHVVYTIPPYLPILSAGIGAFLGGNAVYSLPSVHVFKHRSRNPDDAGLAIMERIIDKRYPDWKAIFRPADLQRLALASGGDLRDFFRLIRICLTRAASPDTPLPVGPRVLVHAETLVRNEMLPLAGEDLEWLKRIAATKDASLDAVKDLPVLARYFETKLVLNYRNGNNWYDVHPLLREQVDAYVPPASPSAV